jgi:hypothetical protein
VNPNIRSHRFDPLPYCFFLAFLLLLPTLAGYPQSSQSASPAAAVPSAISVKSELVALPVRVTDSNGNFVSGLTMQDFHVFENGRPQALTLFRQEDAPVTVGLVVDHSRSMGPKLLEVAAAVSAFSHSSNLQDEMFVVDFNDEVWLQILGGKPFTHDAKELEKAVGAVSARGRTALYDAVAEGLNHLSFGQWEKKALIIVSDGGDNASHQKFSQVLALAQRSQVPSSWKAPARKRIQAFFEDSARAQVGSPISPTPGKPSRASRLSSPAISASSTRLASRRRIRAGMLPSEKFR